MCYILIAKQLIEDINDYWKSLNLKVADRIYLRLSDILKPWAARNAWLEVIEKKKNPNQSLLPDWKKKTTKR